MFYAEGIGNWPLMCVTQVQAYLGNCVSIQLGLKCRCNYFPFATSTRLLLVLLEVRRRYTIPMVKVQGALSKQVAFLK
jgi:hypothetical protein